jgi:hypothetical protein
MISHPDPTDKFRVHDWGEHNLSRPAPKGGELELVVWGPGGLAVHLYK